MRNLGNIKEDVLVLHRNLVGVPDGYYTFVFLSGDALSHLLNANLDDDTRYEYLLTGNTAMNRSCLDVAANLVDEMVLHMQEAGLTVVHEK
jgi:hypothetical protein